MRDYEVTVLITGKLDNKEVEKELKQLASYFSKVEAKTQKDLSADKRPLAYEIAKNREAFYVFTQAAIDPQKLTALDSLLKNDDRVIRYLLVKKEA